MSRDRRAHVVLIGVDGATFAVLDPMMRDGVMPFLRDWSRGGVRAVLGSTAHPLTPIAWTTLMTGRYPGNHGVFDFVRADLHAPQPSYALGTSADVRVETLWAIASRHGRRVTCLNFPCMFPPPPIDGFVVPGFVPWRYLARAVHPRDLYPRLKNLPDFDAKELALDWDTERKALQGLPESEFEDWIRFHIAREAQWFSIAQFLMREEPCELTAILFDGVDKLQHLCYHLIDPAIASQHTSAWAQRVRGLCLEFFRQLDRFIGAIVKDAGPAARVFIASDHGFHAAGNQIFYANVWLEEQGYFGWKEGTTLDHEGRLTLEGHAGPEALIDWSRTVAFALTASSNAIWIRRRTNGPGPGVPDEEYGHFRQRLIDGLGRVTNPATGERLIERVMTREEAFPGAAVDDAPDLTLVMRDRSFISVLRTDAVLKPRHLPYGTHHPDGIFMAAGPGLQKRCEIPPFSIVDITPTLLHALELPLPRDLDGAAMTAAFEPAWIAAHPVRYDEEGGTSRPLPHTAAASLGAEGDEEILRRLRALGYLE
jgi:predicted AlkP superfamily phosphohydrolase/phosphomutase